MTGHCCKVDVNNAVCVHGIASNFVKDVTTEP